LKILIQIKRVYEEAETGDGRRFLVDRLWPRGIKKEDLRIDGWLKEAAPSHELRKWYNHEPERWEEFKVRYFTELKGKDEILQVLKDASTKGNVTLLYSARNKDLNNASALKLYLERDVLEQDAAGK
jgi:uncharacterized protein YeaO (DUF488 family)